MATPLKEEGKKFFKSVRKRFENQPAKFKVYIEILRDIHFKNYDDISPLTSKLKNIFSDDQDLFLRLNDFLPERCRTYVEIIYQNRETVPMKNLLEGKYNNFSSPSEFVSKITDRCVENNDFSMLMKFMKIMVSYKTKEIDAKQVDTMFRKLFKPHPDLFVECTRFLVDSLDFVFPRGWSNGTVVKELSLFEETMLLKEFYLYEMDVAIEELYNGPDRESKDCGEEMRKILLHKPVDTAKVLAERMKQKMEQLTKQKQQTLEKIWKEVNEDIEGGRNICHAEFREKLRKASEHRYK